MTIDEAIKRLEISATVAYNIGELGRHEALKLGIEALKSWKFVRADRPRLGLKILPGETKE